MRAPLAALFALVLVATPALAQTLASPLQGKYDEVYVIFGRALDSAGLPVRGGIAVIEFDQEGVKMAPTRAGINCKGDFIAEFNLKHVEPSGKVKVTVLGPEGRQNATATAPLDPFYRRSDLVVRLGVPWQQECKNERDVWAVSASVNVRMLNRTESYLSGEEKMYARVDKGIYKMRYEPPDGAVICPPHPQDQTPGACELFQPDDRGDIRYTFTLDTASPPGGRITLTSVTDANATWVVEVEPTTRLGTKLIEVSGRGPPPEIYDTPLGGLVLVGLSVAMAMAFSRARR